MGIPSISNIVPLITILDWLSFLVDFKELLLTNTICFPTVLYSIFVFLNKFLRTLDTKVFLTFTDTCFLLFNSL